MTDAQLIDRMERRLDAALDARRRKTTAWKVATALLGRSHACSVREIKSTGRNPQQPAGAGET